MKTFKWLTLSLFVGSILILALSEGYTVAYKNSDRMYVLASSLNMRSQPSVKARKIATIPLGARVKVIKKTNKAYQSEGIKGHWVKVKYGKRIGYLFDGYLSKLPAPPKNSKSLKHYADSKLTKIGQEQKKVIEGKMDSKNPKDNIYPYHAKFLQKYKYNAKLQTEFMYDPRAIEVTSYTLIIKNISLEEGFLIGRLCRAGDKSFRNKAFKVNNSGTVELEGERGLLKVKKDSKGFVHIGFTLSL